VTGSKEWLNRGTRCDSLGCGTPLTADGLGLWLEGSVGKREKAFARRSNRTSHMESSCVGSDIRANFASWSRFLVSRE